MTLKAKPILDDKFWILEEDDGERVGTLAKDSEGFVLTKKGEISFIKDERQLKTMFGKNFITAQIITPAQGTSAGDFSVHGYPTKWEPFNSMYDIQRKLPLFTKSEKSQSVYCAGYYLIKFKVNWLKSYCPKVSTIEQNEYLGPFKSKNEMKAIAARTARSNVE